MREHRRGRDVKGHNGREEVQKGNKKEILLSARNKWLEMSEESNETRLVALSSLVFLLFRKRKRQAARSDRKMQTYWKNVECF